MLVFEFKDYRAFLRQRLPIHGEHRGIRTRLAEALNCRLAFISNVLNGLQHFSLEHGVVISEFLKLSHEEQQFFLLLIQHGRAGTKKLEAYFEMEIKRILQEREKIRNRIHVEGALSEKDQSTYYSSWLPITIHVLTAIPALQTRSALIQHLRITAAELHEPLEFLLQSGILRETSGRLERGPTRIHLDPDSPQIRKHHANWRLRAIEAVEREPLHAKPHPEKFSPLHYSLVMSLSQKDLGRVRDLLLETISKTDEILKPSPEEKGASLNIDLFEV